MNPLLDLENIELPEFTVAVDSSSLVQIYGGLLLTATLIIMVYFAIKKRA